VTLDGKRLASGAYFYRLQARGLGPAQGGTRAFVETRRLLFLK
jgi:hypothetical protein